MIGYANLWVVKFGKMLEKALQGKGVQDVFKSLAKYDGTPDSAVLIKFDLNDYKFGLFRKIRGWFLERVTPQVHDTKRFLPHDRS